MPLAANIAEFAEKDKAFDWLFGANFAIFEVCEK